MYPNDVPAAVCQDDEDEDTFEKLRREIISGGDRDPRVNVDRADSIENRLDQLIRWLGSNRAPEGWRQFLADDDLDWSKVVLAGHSQGGGHAQLLAKDHAVARLVVLGSPKDYNLRHGRPAAWYGGGATPASANVRVRARAGHAGDQLSAANGESSGIRTDDDRGYGQAGPAVSHAHVLTTNQGGTSDEFRVWRTSGSSSTSPCRADPTAEPLYRPVWMYMLTTPAE